MEDNHRVEEYGQTGDPEKDGILTPDQQEQLNKIQSDAADALLNHLKSRKEGDLFPMAVMATGIGKTRVEHLLIERTKRINPNAKTLFIAGTKLTLVDQSGRALESYQQSYDFGTSNTSQPPGAEYIESEESENALQEESLDEIIDEEQKDLGIYSVGRFPIDPEADVQVSTIQGVQSANKRGRLSFDDFDLVIPDEAHNIGTSDRTSTIKQFKNVAGLTATAYRSSGRMRAPEHYGFEVVYQLTLPDAQDKEFLPPLVAMQLNTSDLVDEIPTSSNGQIDYRKLEKILKESPELRPYIADRVAGIIKDRDKEYKTVIATNFVWEAQELAQLLKARGIKVGVAVNQNAARAIDSEEIPALKAIDRYKLPREDPEALQVLISPYVASEGFDAPFTEVLVWASPTDSALRYTQYTGRLARRVPGKAYGLIVDCLFQTNQYNWNYNFAMWMKGEAQQLDNGLLYLGPERKIGSVKNLKTIHSIETQIQSKDKISLIELQAEGIEELKDTDFPITSESLRLNFRGGGERLRTASNEVIEEIKRSDPELVTMRRNRSATVTVITNPDFFIQKMNEKGVESQVDLPPLQENDFPINTVSIGGTFKGDRYVAFELANEVLEGIEKENPDLITLRKNGPVVVKVVTDRDLFIGKMLGRGASLKPPPEIGLRDNLLVVQEGDFVLSMAELRNAFVGQPNKIMNARNKVVAAIKSNNPELFTRRISPNGKIVEVVTDREEFIKMMQEGGLLPRTQDVSAVQESDFVVSQNSLGSTFKGAGGRVRSVADEVLKELGKEFPDLVAKRKNGPNNVLVVTNKNLFIQRMQEKGIKLKMDDLLPIQEKDLIVGKSLESLIVGGYGRFMPQAEEVIGEIQTENPSLVAWRMRGNKTVRVITDREVFIQKMLQRGFKLKEGDILPMQSGDFLTSYDNLATSFIGNPQRLVQVSNEVMSELEKEHPETVVARINGTVRVRAVLDKELYIKKMQERGIRLRE